jgi:hypothetical protein
LLLLFSSCGPRLLVLPDEGTYRTYNYKFERYEPYLSVESVYKDVGRAKFEDLKSHFLKVWLYPYEYDTNKVFKVRWEPAQYGWQEYGWKDYIEPNICYFNNRANGFGDYSLMKVYVDNILHTKNFDTLLVLMVTYEAMLDSNGNVKIYPGNETHERLRGNLVRVLIHEGNQWEFVCEPIRYGIADFNNYSEKLLSEFRRSLKRQIIRCSYFKKDLTPDPTFWNRMFTDPDIFFPDPYKDGFPLH